MSTARVSAALFVAATGLAAGPSSVAASDVVVGSDQRKTYDCRGGSATVEGGFNVVTFRNCVTVTVEGGENTVDAGLAETIEIEGGDNRITWTERADGRRPRIANKGTDNVISSRPPPAGAAPAAATRPAPAAAPRPATPRPADRVTITSDGVKVQGAEGTVTVGGAGGGTVTIKQAPSGAAAGKIRIDEDGRKADHDCRGGSALVNGDGNDVVLRNCDRVTVNGNGNAVAVRAVAVVLINGGDNKLVWEEAADGSRPRITDNGRGNTVSGKR